MTGGKGDITPLTDRTGNFILKKKYEFLFVSTLMEIFRIIQVHNSKNMYNIWGSLHFSCGNLSYTDTAPYK